VHHVGGSQRTQLVAGLLVGALNSNDLMRAKVI
jgi:hypothetical protein